MSKGKSILVTGIVAVMLSIIIFGLYLLKMKACVIIVIALAVYGYISFAATFCVWLEKEQSLAPASVEWKPDEEFEATYEEIKAEVEAEQNEQDRV